MTAEETALEEFRRAVSGVRLWRRNERRFLAQIQRAKEPDRIARLAMDTEASRCGKSEAIASVRSLARIIRAIRAERENRPRIVDVDVLGIAPKEVYPEPVDRHTSSSWQMYRFRFGELVEIDLGRGRVIRIHGGPRAGAAEEAAR